MSKQKIYFYLLCEYPKKAKECSDFFLGTDE